MQEKDDSEFGPNGRAVSTVLHQAAAISLDDMAALAASINAMSGKSQS
jgi:hypothetical protein